MFYNTEYINFSIFTEAATIALIIHSFLSLSNLL